MIENLQIKVMKLFARIAENSDVIIALKKHIALSRE